MVVHNFRSHLLRVVWVGVSYFIRGPVLDDVGSEHWDFLFAVFF